MSEHYKNAKSHLRYIFLSLYFLFASITVFTSARHGTASKEDSSFFTTIISLIKPLKDFGEYYGDLEGLLRKLLGHYALFFITGVFYALTVRSFKISHLVTIYSAFVSAMFLGSLNEAIQYFVPLRNCSVIDVVLDTHAYFIGGVTIIFLNIITTKTRDNKVDYLLIADILLLSVAINLFYLFLGEKNKHINFSMILGNAYFAVIMVLSLIKLAVNKNKLIKINRNG